MPFNALSCDLLNKTPNANKYCLQLCSTHIFQFSIKVRSYSIFTNTNSRKKRSIQICLTNTPTYTNIHPSISSLARCRKIPVTRLASLFPFQPAKTALRRKLKYNHKNRFSTLTYSSSNCKDAKQRTSKDV